MVIFHSYVSLPQGNQQDLNLSEKMTRAQGPRSLFLVQWESCQVFRREIFDQMRQSYDVIKIVIYQHLQIMAHHGDLFLAAVMY